MYEHRVQGGDSRRRQNMPRTEGLAGLHWEAGWEPRRPQTPAAGGGWGLWKEKGVRIKASRSAGKYTWLLSAKAAIRKE